MFLKSEFNRKHMDDKLQLLDQEIRQLHRSCKQAGYSAEKIRKTAHPVLHAARRGYLKKCAKRVLVGAGAVLMICSLFYFELTYYALRVTSKKAMVKMLPFYDWTKHFDIDCAIKNPFHVQENETMDIEDCEVCLDLHNLTSLSAVTTDNITEKIFDLEPFIVSDATHEWLPITFNEMLKLHMEHPTFLNESQTDYFHMSSTESGIGNSSTSQELMKFLEKEMDSEEKSNFTAIWSTVQKESFTLIHKHYYRPYFMPAMCEFNLKQNYILMGRRNEKKGRITIMLPIYGEIGIWIAQLDGISDILLKPIKLCSDCPSIYLQLKKGEIINIPIKLYTIAFRPRSYESLAVGVGYNYS